MWNLKRQKDTKLAVVARQDDQKFQGACKYCGKQAHGRGATDKLRYSAILGTAKVNLDLDVEAAEIGIRNSFLSVVGRGVTRHVGCIIVIVLLRPLVL